MNYKKYLLGIIIGIIIIIFGIVKNHLEQNRLDLLLTEYNKMYPALGLSDEINAKVISIFEEDPFFRDSHHFDRVNLDNGEKYGIHAYHKAKGKWLTAYLKPGVIVVKSANESTIQLIDPIKNSKNIFQLVDYYGEPISK